MADATNSFRMKHRDLVLYKDTSLNSTEEKSVTLATELLKDIGGVETDEYRSERIFDMREARDLLDYSSGFGENAEYLYGFEVLFQNTTKDQRDAEIEQIKRKRKQKADDLHLPDSLYTTSREQRNRVLKTLKLEEGTKRQLQNEEISLEEILHNYVDEKEQHRIAKEGKAFLGVFREAKEELNRNPLLSDEEKAERLYRMAKPYETAIAMYKDEYFITLDESSRQKTIEELLDRITRFFDLYDESRQVTDDIYFRRRAICTEMGITESNDRPKFIGHDEDGIEVLERVHVGEKVRKRACQIDKSNPIVSDKEQDKNLSFEQTAGIEAIDRYLIEQGHDMSSGYAFLDRILRLSKRDRLLLYGLIEKDRLACPNASDIAYTQLSYVPNPITFAKKMSNLPGFMWGGSNRRAIARTFTGMHWEKLEAAIGYLKQSDVTDVKSAFAKLQGPESESIFKTHDMMDVLKEDLEAETIAYKDKQDMQMPLMERERTIEKLSRNLREYEIERDKQLLATLEALEKCRDAMTEAEKSRFHKASKTEIADNLKQQAKDQIQKLETADKALFGIMNNIRKMLFIPDDNNALIDDTKEKLESGIKTPKPGESLGKKIVGGSIVVGSQASLLLSKMNQVATIMNGESSTAIGITSGAFASVTGVIGIIGGVLGAIKLVSTLREHGASLSSSDITNMLGKTARGFIGSGWGIAAGGYQIGLVCAGKTAKSMAETAVKNMDKVLGEQAKAMSNNITAATNVLTGVNVAVAGIKLGVDAFDAGVQIKHIVHHGIATYRVYKLEKKGELKGDDAAYADNILKLDRRKKVNEAIETANSVAMTGAGLAATLLGGPIALVGYTVGSVVDLVAMKLFMKAKTSLDRYRMIEDFLQLEKVTRQAFPNYDKMLYKEQNRAREVVREEMMSELGFVSFKAFSKHIAGNYAKFIYDKLFFKTGENNEKVPLLKSDDKNKKLTDMSLACYQMVKSLGLRVVFPDTPGGDRYPTPDVIASKIVV